MGGAVNERDRDDLASLVFAAAGLLLVGTILIVAIALATRSAWNMVIPDIFGLPPLTMRNAFGLVGLGVVLRFFPVLSKE